MKLENNFSDRFGFGEIDQAEITIRKDAPYALRGALVVIAEGCGLTPKPLRQILCRVLLLPPDTNNWTEYPNILDEVNSLLENCTWYEVYDCIEAIYEHLRIQNCSEAEKFEKNINKIFIKNGIGWKLYNGLIEIRGTEEFEEIIKQATESLEAANKNTAKSELHKALEDLSKRPEPDLTGAIQHSMAALECTARDVVGTKDTLGTLIQRNRTLFPPPLDQAIEKLWGFASENGRHLLENREIDFKEVELVVGICAVLSNYLITKFSGG